MNRFRRGGAAALTPEHLLPPDRRRAHYLCDFRQDNTRALGPVKREIADWRRRRARNGSARRRAWRALGASPQVTHCKNATRPRRDADFHRPTSARTIFAPSTIAFILPNADSRGRYFRPQSGATMMSSALR